MFDVDFNSPCDEILDHIYTDYIYNQDLKTSTEITSRIPLLMDNHLATMVNGTKSSYAGYVDIGYHCACKFICKYNKANKKFIEKDVDTTGWYSNKNKQFANDLEEASSLSKYNLPNGLYTAEFKDSNYALLEISANSDNNRGPDTKKWTLYFIGKKFNKIKNKYFEIVDKYSDLNQNNLTEQVVYTNSREAPKDIIFKSFDQMVIRDKEKYLDYIDNWLSKIPLFYKKGIPCKLSVLLYGKPGTGKSTFTKALAKKLGIKQVCSISPWYFSSDDRDSISSSKYTEPIVLSIDDIDCICPNRESADDKKYDKASLASILEFLDNPPVCYYKANDGIYYPISIVVATTNYYDKIDSAVKRYGRFDLQIELNEFNLSEAEEMAKIYGLSLSDVLSDNEINKKSFNISPAYLQSLCIEKVDNNLKSSI